MQRVTLFSDASSPHLGRIEFSEPNFHRGYFTCTAAFEIDGEESLVTLEMIEMFRADTVGFFDEMAAEAKGWDGAKRWESEFSQLQFDVENPGNGVAVFKVCVQWAPEYEVERRGVLHVSADDLPRAAEQLRQFFGVEEGDRI